MTDEPYQIWEIFNQVTKETKFVTYGRLEEYLLHMPSQERDNLSRFRIRIVSL